MVRDLPRSRRGWGAKASKPPLRYRSAQASNVSSEIDIRLEWGMSKWRAAISWARRVSSPRGRGSSTNDAITPYRKRAIFSALASIQMTSWVRSIRPRAARLQTKAMCAASGGRRRRLDRGYPTVGSEKGRPAQQVESQTGKQEAVGRDPADGLEHVQ